MLVNSCLSVHLTHSGHPPTPPTCCLCMVSSHVSPTMGPGKPGAWAGPDDDCNLGGCRTRAAHSGGGQQRAKSKES